MSSITKELGLRIKNIRNIKRISQEELAHRANMHASHIGQIERGEKSPTIESLDKIVKALDITFEELFSFKTTSNIKEEKLSDKISSYVEGMSPDKQKDILKIVKILNEWDIKM